jgi:hypothetical protein
MGFETLLLSTTMGLSICARLRCKTAEQSCAGVFIGSLLSFLLNLEPGPNSGAPLADHANIF